MWSSLAVLLAASCVCLAQVRIKIKTQESHAFDEISGDSDLRFRRMVGGTLAPHVPWQAMVYLSENVMNGGFAGGALISDRWVLTAGRNLFVRKSRQDTQGKEPIIPKVYLGITRRSQANASKEVAVEKVVLHPGFQNVSDWDNDLALIQLKRPFTLSEDVMPIPLPERGEDLAEAAQKKGIITGWGLGVHFTPAESLKHLVLPVVSHGFCKAEYNPSGQVLSRTPTIDDNMFCTGASKYQENVCFGDAGGALAVQDPKEGRVYAAGILSFDKACAVEKYAVYMKLSAYMPWINSVLRGDSETSASLRSSVMSDMYSRQL
ncbi:haptoglobin-like isoform X1 [Oncorhynchus nerka]|uniref:haptoglobin-like isoform X1 n=2 Tax=Oncorhynchus nerka TaxID=8023 RepID=UPI001130DAB0|nr:haptoglobin-like isoform X1 [Oncorhynchus nerka]